MICFFHFSGQDVLQVYNVQQVKHRLQTAACYIANTKPTGFTLEVSNNDNAIVIVGESMHDFFSRQITKCRCIVSRGLKSIENFIFRPKMAIFRRAGIRKAGLSLPLAFQYLILTT